MGKEHECNVDLKADVITGEALSMEILSIIHKQNITPFISFGALERTKAHVLYELERAKAHVLYALDKTLKDAKQEAKNETN